MGILANIIENIKQQQQEREDIDDEQTKDRYLRSLRRQRRTQLEEIEKERLLKDIKEHNLQRTREAVLGIKPEKSNSLIKPPIKQQKKKHGFFDRGKI